jgi:predicted ATPase
VRARPELLARHLTESGEMQRATGYWLKAGRGAVERSANAEAVAHLRRGLKLLESLPDSTDRTACEVAMLLTLGVPLQSIKGAGSPETEQVYRRAGDLSRTSGDTLSLFFANWGLWRFHSANSSLSARDFASNLLELAQGQDDPALLLQAHHAHWTTLYNFGEFGAAQAHIDDGLALYDREVHGDQAFLVAGHDPSICAHLTAARILWITGYPEQAAKRTAHALDLAEELGHPSSVAISLNHAIRFCVRSGDFEAALRWMQPLRTLAAEHGFAGHVGWCDLVQVWLDARQNGDGERIEEMLRVLRPRPELAGVEGAFAQAVLADACRAVGRTEDGLDLLAEPAGKTDSCNLMFWDAERARLRGFGKSIAIAQQQNAKSLELRGATSLARLWHAQGKTADSRDLLAPIHGWFTEGHDLLDLTEAKALLDELSN